MQDKICKIKDFDYPKIKADFIMSLGSNCRVAHYLRKNHLRNLASPFDWMINEKLEIVYELIKTDFKNFFLNCSKINNSTPRTICVKDNTTQMVSIHHFFANEDLKLQAQRLNKQAIKRWNLIKEKINHSKSVVFVRNGNFDLNLASDFLRKTSALFARGGGITLINVSHDANLAKDEVSMQVFRLDEKLTIIHYKTFDNDNGAWGNALFWVKMMKSIKMPILFKIKNAWSDFKIRFIRSCKKRMEFFTKKYKYNIDETH